MQTASSSMGSGQKDVVTKAFAAEAAKVKTEKGPSVNSVDPQSHERTVVIIHILLVERNNHKTSNIYKSRM